MKRYQWRQLSQWDMPPHNCRMKFKNVKTSLSEATCSYFLAECTDKGNGVTGIKAVLNDDVTGVMLDIANGVDSTDKDSQ